MALTRVQLLIARTPAQQAGNFKLCNLLFTILAPFEGWLQMPLRLRRRRKHYFSMNFTTRTSARCRYLRRTQRRHIARDIIVFDKGKQYNQIMQEKMQWTTSPFEYDFERGLYYHHILTDELLCGSQPTSVDDIRYLKEAENVNVIVSLQQEKDARYWGVDTNAIHHAMHENDVAFKRIEVVDFDPESLRKTLPKAVHEIATAIDDGQKVYVHCTAGLGRAPACCIAYLFWFRDFNLDEAYEHLTKIRPCGPNRDAIRGATYDIVSGGDWHAFQALAPHMYTTLQKADKHMLQYHIFQKF